MDLSIIIVTYQSEKVIKNCLNSIYQNTQGLNFEVILLDNNSQDQTVAVIKNEFPQVKLVETGENLGFAKAVNRGIKMSQGKAVLLMNPDMVVVGDAITDSLKYLNLDNEAGILGCKFVYPDNRLQPSFGNYPTLKTELLFSTFLYKIFPYGKIIPSHKLKQKKYSYPRIVDWVSGGFMLIKKAVMQSIGMLDENMFMYVEDVDFCKRANRAGFKIIYYPKAEVIHHHGHSAKSDFSRSVVNEAKSLLYYFKKYMMNAAILKFLILLRTNLLILKNYILSIFKEENKISMREYIKAKKEIKAINVNKKI